MKDRHLFCFVLFCLSRKGEKKSVITILLHCTVACLKESKTIQKKLGEARESEKCFFFFFIKCFCKFMLEC